MMMMMMMMMMLYITIDNNDDYSYKQACIYDDVKYIVSNICC